MLKISHISKTFNPGTVNEKKAIEDLSLELKQGDFCNDHWLQWRWKVHVIQCNLRRFPDRYRLDRTG